MKEDDSGVRSVLWEDGSGSYMESRFEGCISSGGQRLLQETEGWCRRPPVNQVFLCSCDTAIPPVKRFYPSHP